MAQDKAFKRPGLWRHPRLLTRRILGSWPLLLWVAAIAIVIYLYQGGQSLRGLEGMVDTTAQPVAPLETARLLAIKVELGQKVKAGDVVATMDTSLVDAEIAQLEAERFESESSIGSFEQGALSTIKNFEDAITSATGDIEDFKRQLERDSAELRELKTEHARLEQLYAKKLIDATDVNASRPLIAALQHEVDAYPALIKNAQKRLDDAERGQADLRQSLRLEEGEDIKSAISRRAEAQRKIFEASRNATLIQHQNYTLTATHDAVVSRIFHQPGDVVSAGDPILRLVSANPVQVIGFLPEVHLADVKEGEQVFVSRQGGDGRTFIATVTSIAPELDTLPEMASPIQGQPLRGRRVIARLDPGHNLIPGESVRIDSIETRFFGALVKKWAKRDAAKAP